MSEIFCCQHSQPIISFAVETIKTLYGHNLCSISKLRCAKQFELSTSINAPALGERLIHEACVQQFGVPFFVFSLNHRGVFNFGVFSLKTFRRFLRKVGCIEPSGENHSFMFCVTLAVAFIFPSGLDSGDLEATIDELAEIAIPDETIGAAIIVSQGQNEIFAKAYGCSNSKTNEPMELSDSLEWGSITKTVTFVCAMQLHEKGLLDLNADIRDYLGKDYFQKLKYPANKITMMNLFNHNAGWEEIRYSIVVTDFDENFELHPYLRKIEPCQIFKPNKRTSYSNYGSAIAGLVVEVITGEPLYAYARRNVFDVLGMTRTTIDPARRDVPAPEKVVQGYTRELEEEIDYRFLVYPAGSGVGPASELAAYTRALTPIASVACPLFEKNETLDLLLTNTGGVPNWGVSHGLWEMSWQQWHLGLEHLGNTLGFSSRMLFFPETDLSIVVMVNSYGEGFLMAEVPFALFGKPEIPEYPIANAKRVIEGHYRMCRQVATGYLGSGYGTMAIYVSRTNDNSISIDGLDARMVSSHVFYAFEWPAETNPFFAFYENDDAFKYLCDDWVLVSESHYYMSIFASAYLSFIGLIGSSLFMGAAIVMWIFYFFRRRSFSILFRLRPVFCISMVMNIFVFAHALVLLLAFLDISNDYETVQSTQSAILGLVITIWVLLGVEIIVPIVRVCVKKWQLAQQKSQEALDLTINDVTEEDKGENDELGSKSYCAFGQALYIIVVTLNMLIFTIGGFATDLYMY